MDEGRDSRTEQRFADPLILGAVDDAWCLRSTDWQPARRACDESLFALANGSLGVRGNAEESLSPTSGSYLAGVFECHPVEFHERLPGFATTTDTRVPVADGTHIALLLGDEALDLETCIVLHVHRLLDLRGATLRRRITLRTPRGATLRIDSERLVSLAEDVLSIRFGVTSIDYAGPLTLVSMLRAGQRAVGQGDDPRIGVVGSSTLHTAPGRVDDGMATLTQRTRHSGIALACVQVHRLRDDGLAFVASAAHRDHVEQRYTAQLRPGAQVTLDKVVAYASGDATPVVAELIDRAAALATGVSADGHDALIAAQAMTMDAFWRDAEITVDADAAVARALRFNLFHLMQSASRSATNGTAAKGLTGEGYEGHCFWDTEVFVLPVMVYTAPAIARQMLGWRFNTLDAARANARQMNHPSGALYPWRTIAGAECSAHYPSGSAAYHINADIAFAIGLYLDATDDQQFLIDEGAEILFETARIWPQAGHFDPLRNGAFGIHCVTGPDEYTALVDNNFYTNRMAQRHLRRAVAAWESLGASHPAARDALAARLSLDACEVDTWRRAADAMQLPVDATLDIYAQDDTFLHKPRWTTGGRVSGSPLLLDCHPLTLYRHQVCKQADVVMALALAGDGLDAARKRRSFDYYEAITTHDSTLSSAIHGIVASELGRLAQALAFFDAALRVDLDDLHGNTGHGVHMAAMAGSWLGVVWGFAGLRVVDARLQLAPSLPPGWRGYTFCLRWQGRRLSVRVDAEATTYAIDGGTPLPIRHNGTALRVGVEPLRVPHRQPAAGAPSPGAVFPRACRALIFDLDGVLTDTAHVHYQAWKRLADRIGVSFDETINRRLKGVDRMASLEIILERADRTFDDAQKQALAAEKNADYVALIERFGPDDLFPGVRDLLTAARAAGLRIALASASRNAATLVARLGIASAFDVVVDSAAIARAKPAPDIFLEAARALGVAPSACIGIEDAAAGVAAIKAAGMTAVGVGDAAELAAADIVITAIAALRLHDIVVLPLAAAPSPSTQAPDLHA